MDALEAAPDGLSVREIETKVNLSYGRIQKTIQLLALESPAPIAALGGKWQLTAARLDGAFWERTERLTELRHAEQRQMQEYVDLSSGHMEFLVQALDGDAGGFQPPDVPDLPTAVHPASVRDAISFLRNASLAIVPRKLWPTGRRIERGHRAQPGRALCAWMDAGWGRLVSDGKYRDHHFTDELVDACAALVREWQPVPYPTWVAAVPSHRRPHLVPDFARRLAVKLQLPFRPVLERKEERPEQKTMENSYQQAHNVLRSLAVDQDQVLSGPVLLVDDMVDSRWTFTVIAWELRRRHCGEVWPLALADAGRRAMMNGTDGLSANTTAILLLTAPLVVGSRRSQAPVLTAGEYRKLAPLLASHQTEPAALLESGADRLLAQCGDVVEEDRLTALLNRGFQLSQAVERWHARGIWVVSRADEAYPPSLKKRLKNDAPSVLYGCGVKEILYSRSLAVVGSREVTEPLIEYTRRNASLIARAGLAIVSGGARGVDRAAMNGALEAGGPRRGSAARRPGEGGHESRASQPAPGGAARPAIPIRPEPEIHGRASDAAQQGDLRPGRSRTGGKRGLQPGRHVGRCSGAVEEVLRPSVRPLDRRSFRGPYGSAKSWRATVARTGGARSD